jgi:predicted transport protein
MENLKSEFQVLEPNTLVEELVNYIAQELPNFKDSEEFVDILMKKKNENQHSLALCVFMTNTCKAKFNFQRENSQKGSSTIDIGIYKGSILIFTIEAKVLPTPLTDSKRKEYEYVYGDGAGIKRFKTGHHGVDNMDNNIDENGLIAYIKESDFIFWHSKVNQWISDAKWNDSEKLQMDYFNHIGKLNSKHERLDNSEVVLHHFWVYVK